MDQAPNEQDRKNEPTVQLQSYSAGRAEAGENQTDGHEEIKNQNNQGNTQ